MILWVLTASVDYEGTWVIGVFTSEEKALEVMYEQISQKFPPDGYNLSPIEVDTVIDKWNGKGCYYRTHKIQSSARRTIK